MLLTREAYEIKEKELKQLRERLKEVGREKALAIEQADGDSRHDNFGFEQAEIQERAIIREINDLIRTLEKSTIVEKSECESKVVNVGDIVKLELDFGEEDTETMNLKLSALSSKEEGIVTLNSPIGKTIFQKNVGFKGECKLATGKTIKVHILDIS